MGYRACTATSIYEGFGSGYARLESGARSLPHMLRFRDSTDFSDHAGSPTPGLADPLLPHAIHVVEVRFVSADGLLCCIDGHAVCRNESHDVCCVGPMQHALSTAPRDLRRQLVRRSNDWGHCGHGAVLIGGACHFTPHNTSHSTRALEHSILVWFEAELWMCVAWTRRVPCASHPEESARLVRLL